MESIKIKNYHPDQLTEMVSFLHRTDHMHRQPMLQNPSRRKDAFYTLFDHQISGLLISWHNSFHPYADYITLILDPDQQHRRAGDILLYEAVQRSSKPYLQLSIGENAYPESGFYESRQFKEVRRTYVPKLSVQQGLQYLLTVESFDEPPTSFSILHLKEWQQHDQDYSRLAKRVYTDYERVHAINPPAPMDMQKWTALLQEDDLMPEGSYIAYNPHNNQILGYALMHKSVEADTVELGWSDQGSYPELRLLLIQEQLKYARQHGYTSIEMEIDSTDPMRMELLSRLPFQPAPALITYQYRK
ncbi:hypothetical protein [Paenibacillus wulumuqiensis]|uniref:hypothetical protein n=1 Tax=Paenibacillus wulumuqiensis TaxID=1567107 RepID=UPI0006199D67|nr:hypothetical protein [Paenibacillus wulumuqiensis]